MHYLALEEVKFFRTLVKGRGPLNDSSNFASLKNLSVSTGHYTIGILLFIAMTAALIALIIAGFFYAVARSSKGYDEVKKRVTRVVIIMVMLTALLTIIGFILSIFTWW